MRVAVLDDDQGVALAMAEWATLEQGVSVQVFHHPLGSEDAIAERLRDFDIIVAMRERIPFPSSLLARLPSLKLLITTAPGHPGINFLS